MSNILKDKKAGLADLSIPTPGEAKPVRNRFGFGALGPMNVGKVDQSLSLSEPLKVPVAHIQIQASRKRSLSKPEFDRLKDSISKDGLLTPISVEKSPEFSPQEPRYIIVSGHNRFQALTELGFTEVPVSLINIKGESERAAFISNLLQPELGIAEIYQGLKILQNASGEKRSNKEIAKETGFSEAYVSQMLQMEKLAASLIACMRENRVRVGSNILKKFIGLFPSPSADLEEYERRTNVAIQTLDQKGNELFNELESSTGQGNGLDQINNSWQKTLSELIKQFDQKANTAVPVRKRQLDLKNWEVKKASVRKSTVTLELSSDEDAKALAELLNHFLNTKDA